VKKIFSELRIKHELASATFMTMATSSPELCISCVSTFITDGDISLGTIVGSAIFNILVVTAFCGFYARSKLDVRLFSRDCTLYALSIIGLIFVIYDHQIWWYEALLMILGYIVYLISNQNFYF
jgi:Ca2+/Na+ antiporter